MTATRRTLGADAGDPHRLARFWAGALGHLREPGYAAPDGASIIDPDGRSPAVSLLESMVRRRPGPGGAASITA